MSARRAEHASSQDRCTRLGSQGAFRSLEARRSPSPVALRSSLGAYADQAASGNEPLRQPDRIATSLSLRSPSNRPSMAYRQPRLQFGSYRGNFLMNINPNDGKRSNVQPGQFGKQGTPQGDDSQMDSKQASSKKDAEQATKPAPPNHGTSDVSQR